MKKQILVSLGLVSTVLLFGFGNKITSNADFLSSDTPKSSLINRAPKPIEATPASVIWPLISDVTTKSLEGNLESNFSFPAAVLKSEVNTKVDFTGDGAADSNIDFYQYTGTNTNSWTGTGSTTVIDETKYVQIDINATNGGTFTINRVEALVGAGGTSNMYYQAFYSLNEDFSDRVQIKNATQLTPSGKALTLDVILPTSVVISGSQKFYLRFYPYIASATTGKQFALRNVKISGTMEGDVANLATVSTTAVSSISTESALSGGTITSNGGGAISASGIVWSTNPNPTTANQSTNEAATTGSYTSYLSGLSAGTTYYVRSYATNSAGTSYGNEISFQTLNSIAAPTVTTVSQSQVTNRSFVVSGNVTNWGGADVTDRGIVWSKNNSIPTLENATKVSTGSGLGAFSSYVFGVDASTLYYVRTFATNNAGTSYGSVATVQTKATDPDVVKVINQNGTGDYITVQAAFDAVPDNYTGKWIIKIKPGTYTERPTLAQNKANVHLVGEDALTTIITNNISAGTLDPSGNAYGTSNSQTMAILGNDFIASKITIANTFVNSTAAAAQNSATQAVALKTQGDRQAFYDCRILGYQDTYLGNSIGRAYFKNCYVEGNVDFIFGRQTVIFDQCTTAINRNNSVVVAPSTESSTKFGFVFLDCNITAPDPSTLDFNGTPISNFHFGRPWQNRPKAAFIRCEVPASLNATGWTTMNGGLDPVFVEYENTGLGATPERLAQRGNGGVVLSAAAAQVYTVANVFKKETDPSFYFDWMPEAAYETDFLDIKTTDQNKAASVFPNPFKEELNIVFNLKANSDVLINIIDINGRVVKSISNKGKSGQNKIFLNMQSLDAGVYFYTLKTNDGTINGKLIRK